MKTNDLLDDCSCMHCEVSIVLSWYNYQPPLAGYKDIAPGSYYINYLHCRTLPGKRCLSHGMCLYLITMALHFLNDVANDAESYNNRKLRHNRKFEE